jgi:hypothetical protein
MAEIRQEQIRAIIEIANLFTVETPYVRSFNISKQRGNIISTFSATIEILVSDLLEVVDQSLDLAGRTLTITAGLRDQEELLFTGEIRSVQVNPSWEKPEYFILNIGGRDVMGRLEGKRYSRRVKWDSAGVWAKITNVRTVRMRKKARGFDKKYVRQIARITGFPDQGILEHSSFVYARDLSKIDPFGHIVNPDKNIDEDKETEFAEIIYV